MSPITRILVRAAVLAMHLPDRLVASLVRVPAVISGQPVDLRTRWFLTLLRLDPTPRHTVPVQEQREEIEHAELCFASAPRPVTITELELPLAGRTLRARVYRSERHPNPNAAMLYVHGGGFVTGSPRGYDPFCSRLVTEAGCTVVSLDYRLAPAAPFPAAVHDVVDAFRWLRENASTLGLDPRKIAVGGDSAGGTLSAVLANELAPNELPAFLLLLYPGTDILAKTRSRGLFARGFYLTMAHVDWFYDTYLPDADDRADPRASPLRVSSPGRAPAIVVLAGLDPLVDEGRAYANRLVACGVPVDIVDLPGLLHGFVSLDGILPAADAAVTRVCRAVASRFAAA